ncbi:hypothetical protein H8356DRAFT_1634158 [Neocallimastix lanati (nom. inval.)]|nr:hypothetical protein H8356DRAFT_1634158 [Neocallimastix sp. JGI-2020a]
MNHSCISTINVIFIMYLLFLQQLKDPVLRISPDLLWIWLVTSFLGLMVEKFIVLILLLYCCLKR